MKNKGLILLSGALLLVGCGSSNTTKTPVETATGTYEDSPIDGAHYVCGTQEGTTGASGVAGGFTFDVGSECIFSVNDIELRTVATGDLSDGVKVREDDPAVARFLQSLDKNGNPNDGIEITSEIIGSLKKNNIDTYETDIDAMVASLKSDLSTSEYNGEAKSLNDAKAHLAKLSVSLSTDKKTLVFGENITLTARATSAIESYVWKDNGVVIQQATGSTLTKSDFSVGPHLISVEATNADDIVVKDTVSFSVTQSPDMNVTVSIPTGKAAITDNEQITFRGNVENPGAGLKYAWIDRFTSATASTPTLGNSGLNSDGSDAGDNHGVPFQYNDKNTTIGITSEITVTLSEGTHNIVLKVTDEDDRVAFSQQYGIWVNFNGLAPNGDYILVDSVKNLTWVNDPSSTFEACFAVYSSADLEAAATHCESLDTFNDGAGYANVQGWRTPTTAEIKDFNTRTYIGNIRPETTSGNPCPYMLGLADDGNYTSVSTRHFTGIVPGTVEELKYPSGLRCVRTGI